MVVCICKKDHFVLNSTNVHFWWGASLSPAILRIHPFTTHLNCSQEGSFISWVLWSSLPRGGLLAVTIIVKANSCPFSQIKTHHCPFTDFRKPLLQRCKSIFTNSLGRTLAADILETDYPSTVFEKCFCTRFVFRRMLHVDRIGYR